MTSTILRWSPTLLILLAYLGIFLSLLLTFQLSPVPSSGTTRISQALEDLQHITRFPHPYNSHSNDAVRAYILSRVRNITKGVAGVEVADDLTSNGTWTGGTAGVSVYFEGTNILIKLLGSEPSLPGVLFSAHYDSVSTANGVTDDGVGVVSLLALLTHFVENKNKPKRTVVFNINNGEEDWLNGAHAYLRHPFSNLTSSGTFLNLEGAAAGSRPLLFRSSSSTPLYPFKSAITQPHANVLSADAFKFGIIRSGTDYSVYTTENENGVKGMNGMDLAFYRGRARYHTKYDKLAYTNGAERSVWSMLSAAVQAGEAMANAPEQGGEGENAVYFDLFTRYMILFPLNTLYISSIVFLVISPLVTIFLLVLERVMLSRRVPVRVRMEGWLRVWEWTQFPAALVLTVLGETLLVYSFLKLNKHVIYSSPILLTISFASLSFLTFSLPSFFPSASRRITLLQLYLLLYVLLIPSTYAMNKYSIGGTYFVFFWTALVWVGLAFSLVVDVVRVYRLPYPRTHEEPSEETPLLASSSQPAAPPPPPKDPSVVAQIKELVEILVTVPLPVVLLSHIWWIYVGAVPETIVDGSSVGGALTSLSVLSTLLILPLVPYTTTFHPRYKLTFLIFLIFSITTLYTWFGSSAFNEEKRMKVYFQQRISFSSSSDSSSFKEETTLTGLAPLLEKKVISWLPSARGKQVNCTTSDNLKMRGLGTCVWESGLLPNPESDRKGMKRWFDKVSVTRIDATTARFRIKPVNSRNCRLYFDNPISSYSVHHLNQTTKSDKAEKDIKEVRLWSRTWEREWLVDVSSTNNVMGRVACDWAEYQSGMVGVPGGGNIPAFEEVLEFLPSWSVVTKLQDGLVEVEVSFAI